MPIAFMYFNIKIHELNFIHISNLTVTFQADQQFTTQQPQSQQTPGLTQEVSHQFSEKMSNEELTLWLSHQPVLVGTSHLTDIIEVIKGAVTEIYTLVLGYETEY